jgi:UDP-N-acetylglucosamine 2-epimerase (non-hydrolysing)
VSARDIILVAGARPNFMKVAPLHRELASRPGVRARLVHTGQHYDPALSEQIMRDLELPAPDVHLGVGKGGATEQLARLLLAFDPLLRDDPPAAMVVVGDVTSTLAGALAASARDVPLAHVEAGLRSFDWSMPEERNRVVVDRLSRWLFASERSGVENLAREGTQRGVHLVGNVMIDSLVRVRDRLSRSNVRRELGLPAAYGVLTLHRPGNVDDPARFQALLDVLAPLSERLTLVFPVHPRTRAALSAAALPPGLVLVDPLGYLDFVALMAQAVVVLTDSGGIQEETTVLGIPCLTLRPNTERPATVEQGTNELVDGDGERLLALGEQALAGEFKKGCVPDLWDGRAASRICDVLLRDLALG